MIMRKLSFLNLLLEQHTVVREMDLRLMKLIPGGSGF